MPRQILLHNERYIRRLRQCARLGHIHGDVVPAIGHCRRVQGYRGSPCLARISHRCCGDCYIAREAGCYRRRRVGGVGSVGGGDRTAVGRGDSPRDSLIARVIDKDCGEGGRCVRPAGILGIDT